MLIGSTLSSEEIMEMIGHVASSIDSAEASGDRDEAFLGSCV
jgi:hypothetical protein